MEILYIHIPVVSLYSPVRQGPAASRRKKSGGALSIRNIIQLWTLLAAEVEIIHTRIRGVESTPIDTIPYSMFGTPTCECQLTSMACRQRLAFCLSCSLRCLLARQQNQWPLAQLSASFSPLIAIAYGPAACSS